MVQSTDCVALLGYLIFSHPCFVFFCYMHSSQNVPPCPNVFSSDLSLLISFHFFKTFCCGFLLPSFLFIYLLLLFFLPFGLLLPRASSLHARKPSLPQNMASSKLSQTTTQPRTTAEPPPATSWPEIITVAVMLPAKD